MILLVSIERKAINIWSGCKMKIFLEHPRKCPNTLKIRSRPIKSDKKIV